jgi:hypothetical protein
MRIVWDILMYGEILKSVGPVFGITIFLEIIIFSFFCYWFLRVIRGK